MNMSDIEKIATTRLMEGYYDSFTMDDERTINESVNQWRIQQVAIEDYDDGDVQLVITITVNGEDIKLYQKRRFDITGDYRYYDVIDLIADQVDDETLYDVFVSMTELIEGDEPYDVVKEKSVVGKLDEGILSRIKNSFMHKLEDKWDMVKDSFDGDMKKLSKVRKGLISTYINNIKYSFRHAKQKENVMQGKHISDMLKAMGLSEPVIKQLRIDYRNYFLEVESLVEKQKKEIYNMAETGGFGKGRDSGRNVSDIVRYVKMNKQAKYRKEILEAYKSYNSIVKDAENTIYNSLSRSAATYTIFEYLQNKNEFDSEYASRKDKKGAK